MDQYHDSRPWYSIDDEEEAACALEATVKTIETAQNGRIMELLKDGSLYLNQDMTSLGYASSDGYAPPMPQQILNITQSICDTTVSKHCEAETKVSFQVEDGDFEAHQCAEDMDKFCWGEMNRLNLYYKAEMAFRDCLWAGDGWLKWYIKNDKAAVERVFPLEILIDDAACMGTEPQEMYQVRYVSRNWALSAYPEFAAQITMLKTEIPPYAWPGADMDVVRLVEGWRLASDEGEDDGRHILACGHVNLIDETYSYVSFPFSRIAWSPALIGAYSLSLVRQLRPLQLELGKMMKRIQHSLHLMSVPRIWQNANTKISPEYNNAIGNVYKYNGQKPDIDTAPSVNPELYAQADRIRERMYEIARSNPMQSGNMPSRFDSRPALREAQEIADQPHAWVGQNWQRLFVDCGRQLVRMARAIVSEHGSYAAFGKARGFLEKIDWAECNLDDNRFTIQPTPTSLLPTTPTGKRLVVQDLMQNGLIQDPNDAWELLAGMPDVDSFKSEKTAQKRLVDKQIYLMIKKRQPMTPDECQDPVYCKRRCQAQLQLLLTKEGVPDDVYDLLDNYISDCDNLYLQANPPPPPPDPAQGQLPPGADLNGGIPGQQPIALPPAAGDPGPAAGLTPPGQLPIAPGIPGVAQ